MNSSPEVLRFPRPLRGVRLAGSPEPVEAEPAKPAGPSAAEWEARVRAAFDEGRAAGERTMADELARQRAAMQELAEGVLKSMSSAVGEVVRETEQQLIELALEVATRLVSGTPVSAEMIEAAVRDALACVETSAGIQVRLHPADFDLLHKMDSEVLRMSGGEGAVQFQPSPDISRGGCVVQTRFGVVDARRETKFEMLRRSLIG